MQKLQAFRLLYAPLWRRNLLWQSSEDKFKTELFKAFSSAKQELELFV